LVKCPRCGNENAQTMAFCVACGMPLMPVQPQSQVQQTMQPMQQMSMPVYVGPSARSLRILVGMFRGVGFALSAVAIFMFSSIFTVSIGNMYDYNPLGTLQLGMVILGLGVIFFAIAEFVKPFCKK
jgi:hypothetical protein